MSTPSEWPLLSRRRLLDALGITTVDAVERVTRAAYPDDQLSQRGLELARDILS